MKDTFLDWLDHRTGYRKLKDEMLFENIPGGARWRYVWGSALTFCFITQVITGFVLWMGYSPSAQTAWESVYYIQYEMTGGWFLRGVHHYTAQIFPVLLILHLMQVVIDGAYKAPREINFWIGLILAKLILAMALTGYLLPWDQKGYWATKVATNIAASTPIIGEQLQRLVLGGSDYGHHTLTRFFALHAGILPVLVAMMLGAHIYVFRRHSIAAKEPFKKPDATFWPDQVLKDAVACMAVLATILFFVLRHGIGHGADLYAPADPTTAFSAARPDWYFLFLFQILKFVPQIVGAFVIPGVIATIIVLMPIVGRWQLGHRFNVGFLACLLVGVMFMTYLAMSEDAAKASYQDAVAQAERDAERVKALARSPSGIPATGAITLLRNDPFTQGPRLFARNCASCHRYDGHDGTGKVMKEKMSASDLKGFASRTWLKGLLNPEQIVTDKYFGATKFKDGKMAKWVAKKIPKFDDEEKQQLRKVIAAISAEAGLRSQMVIEQKEADDINEGRSLVGEIGCTDCHQYREPDEDATAPDLTGYGSREWLIGIINDPAHARFYGSKNDRMPSFGRDEKLRSADIGMIADWLRGDWYTPGQHVAAVTAGPDETTVLVDSASATRPKVDTPMTDLPEVPSEPQETTTETPTENEPQPVDTEKTEPASGLAQQAISILEKTCFKCHGPEKQKGKLRLDTRELALKGGDNGPAFVSGKPDESALIKLASLPEDHDDIMPPKGEPLSKDQIQVLRSWIEAGAAWTDSIPATSGAQKVDFISQIRPIFEKRCVGCHGPEKRKGKFLMHTRIVALKGGDSGTPAIVPGKPDESPLLKLVSLPEDHDDIMPPKGDPLTQDQISLIRTWIQEGAVWPDGLELKPVQ